MFVGCVQAPPPDSVPGSVGSWCYDEEGTAGLEALIAQCGEAGVEMIVVPQNINGTWRSMIANEFPSTTNTSWFKRIVTFAHAVGIEMGTYQLLLNARSATAINQCAPADAVDLPGAGYDTMDPALM